MNSVELHVEVTPDALRCLDLVLDHTGVSSRDLRVDRCGGRLIIDAGDSAEAARIAVALRSRLGGHLLRCSIDSGKVSKRGRSDRLPASPFGDPNRVADNEPALVFGSLGEFGFSLTSDERIDDRRSSF